MHISTRRRFVIEADVQSCRASQETMLVQRAGRHKSGKGKSVVKLVSALTKQHGGKSCELGKLMRPGTNWFDSKLPQADYSILAMSIQNFVLHPRSVYG